MEFHGEDTAIDAYFWALLVLHIIFLKHGFFTAEPQREYKKPGFQPVSA